MQLHMILKFGSFAALLDLLKIFLFKCLTQYLWPIKIVAIKFLWEAIKQCPLQPFPKLVMGPNHTCLLLTPLLSPLIIWLAEMLTLLKKESTFNFWLFFRTCTYYSNCFHLNYFHTVILTGWTTQ